MNWQIRTFKELTTEQLFEILQLRIAVFVVEQDCPYQEADELDKSSSHLCGYGENGDLIAYLRIVPPGAHYTESAIGRVLVAQNARGGNHGKALMQEGIRVCRELHPTSPIRIGAQTYLIKFYESLGFEIDGEPYLEDGIEHIEMTLAH